MLKLRVVIASCALVVSAACHHNDARSASFVGSMRCGMTRAEVARLAHERGYDDSDASWLARSTKDRSKKSKELQMLDLTFREDRLVAFREGKYDPRTKRIEYRTVDLCRPR